MSINLIVLDENMVECTVCGTETRMRQFVPMFEGKVVPDDSEIEWAGMPVCKGCYDEVEKRKHEICSCGDTVLPLSYQFIGSHDAFCQYCDKPICRRDV